MRRVDARLGALLCVIAGSVAALMLSSMVGAQSSSAPSGTVPAMPAALDESTPAPAAGTGVAQSDGAWSALPLAEREDLRARYRAWQQLSASERSQLAEAANEVAALPTEEQMALRTQFQMQDQMHKRGWRLGPTLGADYPRLHALFGYVPAAQREACLTLLRQLGPEARDDLAVLAQRIPPQQRDAFRTELLQVAPANRAAWLQQRRQQ
ncbi:DUF3106 domain-containing protein [Pseudoxanthomonas dokdonensis]|uniref:DUF3106 domain-containing protein n=1 Tax=Pseudoxanthomonas dokdonensis TaxID=344882 RepID=A0A0R0CIP3_9GAMM|nr:DUF3106 domain-containing protein [Pseudoxanthomonas dokdonensis]KRG69360.1 hypothetical protein ABB29_09675 [Pseudoxanthomonas dokdonensis]